MTATEMIVDEREDAMTAFAQAGIGIEHATAVANQLAAIVKEKKLFVVINQKPHLYVEAWCTCAGMCGLSPRTVWCHRITDDKGLVVGYEARVEVVRLSTDQVVGSAEAECWMDEKLKGYLRWKEKHAAKSMAQTRGTSKAIAQILRWIPVLAGFSGTPAEEAEGSGLPPHDNPPADPAKPKSAPRGQRVTDEQLSQFLATYKACKRHPDEQTPEAFRLWCTRLLGREFNVRRSAEWTAAELKQALTALEDGK